MRRRVPGAAACDVACGRHQRAGGRRAAQRRRGRRPQRLAPTTSTVTPDGERTLAAGGDLRRGGFVERMNVSPRGRAAATTAASSASTAMAARGSATADA
jgi:hypothetical protein